MIPFIVSILCSSLIFVLFKLFPRFKIDTFQAIVFNYVTAFVSGFVLFGSSWKTDYLSKGEWPIFALLAGLLFISLFKIMGDSSQKNGVAMTSIAVKMSMALSMLAIIIFYNEAITLLKVSGILLAFVGVILVTFSKKEPTSTVSIWMLLVLFIGSGFLDFILNYVQSNALNGMNPGLFSAIGFGIAGVIGFLILGVQLWKGKTSLQWRNVFAGILLGIPNYFSIYLLIVSYSSTGWNDSTVLAIMNVSIVLIAAMVGFSLFKEHVTKRKIVGIITAITAILVLFFANK
jgi:drug/metabolite transporter (DMT)-like permease